MKQNQKVFISVIVILVALVMFPKGPKLSIAPECFTNEECWVQTDKGFCSVNYACVSGHCTSVQVLCPENCKGGIDEDRDGKIDCRDPDCYGDSQCHCQYASFNQCNNRQCYCPSGTISEWVVEEDDSYCRCG